MADPDLLLEGAGVTKRVRWLTFLPGDVIDDERLAPLLREAVRVATCRAASGSCRPRA